MTRTELEKLTKEDLITEYLDLLDDYYWYCNRFKASESYNKVLIEKINRASAIIESYTTLNPTRVREKLLKILSPNEDEDRTGDEIMNKIKFILSGCDISFYAIAPEDITLKQLLKQCDRIAPDWCTCGIYSEDFKDEYLDLIIDYDDIRKANEKVNCKILGDKE